MESFAEPMTSVSIEILLKRDRRIVIGAIVVLTALAWGYLIWLARGMSAPGSAMPAMPGMDVSTVITPMLRKWSAGDFTFVFLMWVIMMVGMMTPSATPMLLIYTRVARQASRDGKPLAATWWFALGYSLSWVGFSLFAAVAQSALTRSALLTPMMAAASHKFAGGVLLVAGFYQLTPMMNNCLSHCQSPFAFITSNGGFKPGVGASVRLGIRHGIYCVGCCWALMALLFVGGVMNIFWIAAIAIHVLIERVITAGRVVAWLTGAVLVFSGLWFMVLG